MQKRDRCKSYLIATFFLSMSSGLLLAQQNTVAAGGDASGVEGKSAYTIGEVVYSDPNNDSGSSSQGVQQVYDIVITNYSRHTTKFSLSAFPNPTDGILYLQLKNPRDFFDDVNFKLLTASGRLLEKKMIYGQLTEIDLGQFANGVYVLQVIKESQEIQSFKIIKNR